MTLALAVLAAAAAVLGLLGLRVVAARFNRFPMDDRKPIPLVELKRLPPDTVHSVELRRLVTVVSNAILNDRSARAELRSVFESLDAPTVPLADSESGDRGSRSRRIDEAIDELEQQWSVDRHSG